MCSCSLTNYWYSGWMAGEIPLWNHSWHPVKLQAWIFNHKPQQNLPTMSVQRDELEFLIKQTCKILVSLRKLDRANTPTHTQERARTHTYTCLRISYCIASADDTALFAERSKYRFDPLNVPIEPLNLPAQVLEASPVTHPSLHQKATLILSFLFFRQPLACSRPLAQTGPGNYILNSCRTWSVLYLSDFSLAQWMFYREKRIPMQAQLACSWTFCGFVKAIGGFAHLQNHNLGFHEGGVETS